MSCCLRVLCYRSRTQAASGRLLSPVQGLKPPLGICSTRPSDTIKTRVLHPGQGDDFVRQTADTSCVASMTERLSIRLNPEQDAVLRRAAEARGESANDFVLRHAVEAAEIELADRRVFFVDDAQ